MKRRPFSGGARSLPLAGAALLVPVSLLPAEDRFWVDPAGGTFSAANKWSLTAGGAGGASTPGTADVANFTLNNTYRVVFAFPTTNQSLKVTNGNVTFDLNALTYNTTASTAALVGAVGQT